MHLLVFHLPQENAWSKMQNMFDCSHEVWDLLDSLDH
jgi:hypothetical protein